MADRAVRQWDRLVQPSAGIRRRQRQGNPVAVKRILAALAVGYVRSWLFLLWSALCVSCGAAAMYVAVIASLERNGLHVAGPVLTRFIGH